MKKGFARESEILAVGITDWSASLMLNQYTEIGLNLIGVRGFHSDRVTLIKLENQRVRFRAEKSLQSWLRARDLNLRQGC